MWGKSSLQLHQIKKNRYDSEFAQKNKDIESNLGILGTFVEKW